MRRGLAGGAQLLLLACCHGGGASAAAASVSASEPTQATSRRFSLLEQRRTGERQAPRAPVSNLLEEAFLRQQPTAAATLLVPLDNDTLPLSYWRAVDAAIQAAGLSTTPKPSVNTASTPAPEPWKKIFQAKQTVQVMDTAEEEERLIDAWQFATPAPPLGSNMAEKASQVREMGVVPYDMQLGARVMYGLSEKNTETPPPTQEFVDQAVIAQCPMVMFKDEVSIRAPHCGLGSGSWVEPSTGRPLLRWKQNEFGGLFFGVDSLVTGEGSVNFADLNERLSLNKYVFDIRNCKGSTYYTVEESIVKVNSIAPRAFSTVFAHDVAQSKEAFFYKYSIKRPNGTVIAETALFRMDQDQVNFTTIAEDQTIGSLIAVASRVGRWRRSQWRDCTQEVRGWGLMFPQHNKSHDTVATVEDLRVAAAAVITLMAFRDEGVGKDGFQHVGQGHLYWDLVRTFFTIFFTSIFICLCWVVFRRKGWEKKLRRICFRAESIFLPKRPVQQRLPVMQPTW